MDIIREPYAIGYKDPSPLKDTYGGPTGRVFIECMRIRPREQDRAASVIVFSHPIGGGAFLPLVTALAASGTHCIYVNPRYRGNDTALIMEKCVLDLGAAIRDLKQRFGYEKVLLGGWSGGGSLSLFYQEQAENPSITHTPAGDAVNLKDFGLVPADGVMLLAAHISRAVTMTEWLDPSVLDEDKPFERDLALNIYHPQCPNKAPFSAEFAATFRAAQIARNRRITARAQAMLAELRASDTPEGERCFTVQGTMSDLRWLDPTQDPSDREPYTCYLGDPRLVNDGPVGLGRFTTARSWLSQWSYDLSNANGLMNGAGVSVPALVLNNTADLACTPSHAARLFDCLASKDKTYRDVQGADHYYIARPDLLPEAVGIVQGWMGERGF